MENEGAFLPDSENIRTTKKREKWSGKFDFIISCLGLSIGLGNIWRFPYLCYKYGGGAFLIPYGVSLVLAGLPMMMLELGLGQFTSRGGWQVWKKIAPLFQGVGVASLLILIYVNFYYIMVLSWSVYYFIMSLTSVLPWSHCGNNWNTDRCVASPMAVLLPNITYLNNTSGWSWGKTVKNLTQTNTTVSISPETVDSTVEFWRNKVLQVSDSIDQFDGIIWEQMLCLVFVWSVVGVCLWKGIRSSGKVAYFTVIFPYLMLVAFIIRGVTLEGSLYGIMYYLKPNFRRLQDPQVWTDATTQVFFSYVIGYGCLTALGSYNKYHNDFYRQGMAIALCNSLTSFVGGFAVFSVLGFMAKNQNVGIEDVTNKGPGLIFITYPKAVTQMPLASLWSSLFFLMMFFVGLDSEFVAVESALTPMVDAFPRFLRPRKGRVLLLVSYCAINVLLGLFFVTRGGLYVFQVFDTFAGSGMSVMWIVFTEAVVVGWVFGAGNFCNILETMLGYRPNRWMFVCWKFLTPLFLMGALASQILEFVSVVARHDTFDAVLVLGLFMSLSSVFVIPLVAVITIIKAQGSPRERLRELTSSTALKVADDWKMSSLAS